MSARETAFRVLTWLSLAAAVSLAGARLAQRKTRKPSCGTGLLFLAGLTLATWSVLGWAGYLVTGLVW